MSKLYLVATPIGNLNDITIRALDTLKSVDVIVAEDARHTLKLLNHFEISKPIINFNRHSTKENALDIISKIINGENIALVTDAGTPAISDPGEMIVKYAIENSIDIVPIPGACALINALIVSGLDTNNFTFVGFLSASKKIRTKQLEKIRIYTNTVIIYVAPHKLIITLNELLDVVGNRKVAIAKELTKIHENVIRGPLKDVISNLAEPKGEYIIVLEGASNNFNNIFDDLPLIKHYEMYQKQGYNKKEIIKLIAHDKNQPKNVIYKQVLDLLK